MIIGGHGQTHIFQQNMILVTSRQYFSQSGNFPLRWQWERAPACRFFVSDSTGVTAFCIRGSANHPPLYSLDRISSRFMTPWVRSRPLVFFPPITANPPSLSSLPYHHYHLTHLCFSLPVSSPQHLTSFALICLRLRLRHFIFVVHIFFVIVLVFDVLVFFLLFCCCLMCSFND